MEYDYFLRENLEMNEKLLPGVFLPYAPHCYLPGVWQTGQAKQSRLPKQSWATKPEGGRAEHKIIF